MDVTDSKSAFFHAEIRRGLQSGRYLPGARIDPNALATRHGTSTTPVKNALFRLSGQGMVASRVRIGFLVPIPTEATLRDLYDGMQLMLDNALGTSIPSNFRWRVDPIRLSPQDDLVKQTWRFFDAIGRATGHRFIYETIKHLNDRLAPIRRAKQGWIESVFEELSEMNRLWEKRDTARLRVEIGNYHRRRKELTPEIVAMISEPRP